MTTPAARRRGFTLIELVVVCGVVCILIALSLPAVQSAREASRRAQCAANLRQLGIAAQGYVGTVGCYPPDVMGRNGPAIRSYFSSFVRLLPYLDQRPLYNATNFQAITFPDVWDIDTSYIWPGTNAANAINSTVRFTSLAVLLCPSDGGPLAETGTNYRGNVGVGPQYDMSAEYPDSGNGLFLEQGLTRPSSVPDGLSHTAMYSERLRGSGGPDVNPDRDSFGLLVLVLTADDLILAARAAARQGSLSGYFTDQGRYWFWTGRERTLYNHAQAPNGMVPDAISMNIMTARGMATARSNHPGGVNALMADGSVRFVSETISQAVWRGLGTRNGRELVD